MPYPGNYEKAFCYGYYGKIRALERLTAELKNAETVSVFIGVDSEGNDIIWNLPHNTRHIVKADGMKFGYGFDYTLDSVDIDSDWLEEHEAVRCECCGEITSVYRSYDVVTYTHCTEISELWCESCTESLAQYIDAVDAYIEDGYVSEYMSENGYYQCERCGDWFDLDCNGCVARDDSCFCSEYCADQEDYHMCDYCGDLVHDSRLIETEDGNHFCDYSCIYDADYRQCKDCGGWYSVDEMRFDGCDWYCEDCCGSSYKEHDYGYKPDPIFHGTQGSHPFMGVELEVDGQGDKQQFIEAVACEGMTYCKYDSSVSRGTELVTHPATLDKHLSLYNWSEWTEAGIESGFKSHDTGTCGLHVHVSADYFGANRTLRYRRYATVNSLVYRLRRQIQLFARRTDRQIEDWCKFYPTPKIRYCCADEYWQRVRSELGDSRYRAVNFQNYSTVEFRVFNGSLKLGTVYATLVFVDGVCRFVKNHRPSECEKVDWYSLVDWIEETCDVEVMKRCFHNYLEERELGLAAPAPESISLDAAISSLAFNNEEMEVAA